MNNHQPTTSREQLGALLADPRLKRLGELHGRFDIMRTLGKARDEVAHSKVLAEFLCADLYPPAQFMMSGLLRYLSQDEDLLQWSGEHVRHLEASLAQSETWRVQVSRERFHIDILVEVHSDSGVLVIGIENKIDAGEQTRQVQRYQDTLRDRFPNAKGRLILFLSPDGRPSQTVEQGHEVPCLTMSYETLSTCILQPTLEHTHHQQHNGYRASLAAFITHIEEELVGTPEVKQLTQDLWREHSDALRLLIQHRPKLDDIADVLQERIAQVLQEKGFEEGQFLTYPLKKRPMTELKMRIPKWTAAGLPLTFMFNSTRAHRLQVRVLVSGPAFHDNQSTLETWAKATNDKTAYQYVDPEFKTLTHWSYWRRVFNEEDYPSRKILGDGIFDKALVEQAIHIFKNDLQLLQKHIFV